MTDNSGTTDQGRCEPCGSTSARVVYSAHDRLSSSRRTYRIVSCLGCGILRTLPEMTDRELEAFYPDDYWGLESEPAREWIRKTQAEKTDFLRDCGLAGGGILDVGCGAGLFLRALDSREWDRHGLDTGLSAVETARKWLGAEKVLAKTLDEARLADASFDVVTLWSALEHSNRPRSTLLEARRILKKGGHVVIQVPNAASYQARWFRGNWFSLDAPRHRYHFTPETLEHLLEATGFRRIRMTLSSKTHDPHALRQSLKTTLYAGGRLGRGAFIACIPAIRPLELIMRGVEGGATITLAAKAN